MVGTVLVVGSTGSIGRPAVAEALSAGFETRALIRKEPQADSFPTGTQIAVGDLTRPETLGEAVEGVTGIIFTHGTYGGEHEAELVNYGAVRNVLSALTQPARIALMTTIGVTNPTPGHDWKRRGERLVRASGLPYTIVRPGWFDHNDDNQHQLVMLQGDTRWAGDPTDGVVSRRQIAQVLAASLSSAAADCKTLELVAEVGPARTDLDRLFAALRRDDPDSLDAVLDRGNLPLAKEPSRVLQDLNRVREHRYADQSPAN